MKKQIKKLLSILMVFAMLIGMVSTQAFAAEDYTWDSGAGILTVNTDAGITAWETAVSATEIKTVVVKNTVATIAGKVFQGLSNLESLTFEGDVTIQNGIVDSVYYYPFSETTKLAEITFGGKVNIGDGVFLYSGSAPNTALKTLSFPAGSTFGSAVFSYCTALKTLSFPAGSTFGSAVFSHCTALEEITFNGDADVTAGGCFADLPALKKIDFKGESKLSSGAFGASTNLAEIKFGGKTNIGSGMFTYSDSAPNTALKTLSFPAGSTFGSAVFSYCTALEEIVFNGAVDIAGGCFANLTALKKIDFKGESNLTSSAFAASTNLAEIKFGGKTNISSGAFTYIDSAPNTALKTLSFPAGSTFGAAVFSYCTALEEIVFNGAVDVTAGGCFANLTALKKIDFKGESKLSSGAFSASTNLEKINFGGKTSIESGMFTYSDSAPNTALKSLSFPAGSTFSSGIFNNCNALKELVFEGNVDLTAGGSIYNTPALERVEFKGESKLANGTLSNSVKLKTLIFGGKTDIGANVFIDAGSQQSSGMDSIVVPAGSTIGEKAFKGANITTIEFKDTTPPEFGVDAFAECPRNGIIYVPAGAYDSYVAALNGDGSSTGVANPVPLQIKEILPTTSVTVVKEWDVPEIFDLANLPESVTVALYAGDEIYGEPVTLNKENNWTCTWTELPLATEDGKYIIYTVDELEAPEGYEKIVEKADAPAGIGFVITNRLKETEPEVPTTTSVTVVKEWDAPEGTVLPESVEVYLLANGQEVTDSRTILDAGNKWTYTWTELPVATEDGTPITYTVDEVKVEGYEKIVEKAEVPAGIGFTITNTKDSDEEGGNDGGTTPTTPSAPSTPSVPDTSDNTGTLMYLTSFICAAAALVAVVIYRRKRRAE